MSTEPLRLGPGREFDLIRGFYQGGVPAPRSDVLVGPGDDCAVVLGKGIALSCDLSVEGVHFRRDWLTLREVGYRAAAAALSDLAAVAARPIGVLAALAVPPRDLGEGAVELMEGVAAAARSVDAILLGGDVSRTDGPLVFDITVAGEAPRPITRSGAQPGDALWVTGSLGAAAAAIRQLQQDREPDAAARRALATPVPRVQEARWLAERGELHALIDLSDGLAGDAAHIAAAGGVRIVLEPEAIPVHPAVRAVTESDEAAFDLAVSGGEDYELCFAAPGADVERVRAAFQQQFGLRLTRVGTVTAGEGVAVRASPDRLEPLRIRGYQHFGSNG